MSACVTCGATVGELGPNLSPRDRDARQQKLCGECYEVEERLPAYLERKAAHERKTMTDSARLRAWIDAIPEVPMLATGSSPSTNDVHATLVRSRAALLRLVNGAVDLLQEIERRRPTVQ